MPSVCQILREASKTPNDDTTPRDGHRASAWHRLRRARFRNLMPWQ